MSKRFLILAICCCQLVVAQQIKFFNTYGHGIFDSGEGVWACKDTGYAVGGITTQSGANGTDMLIYKVDSLGNLQWYKNIGLDNHIEGAKSITCGNGGTEFVLAGYQNSYDTSGYNFYVAKTDQNGDTLWTRAYGGADWDMAYSVDTLQDSTYVIAGETYSFGNGNSDMYVIRIDQNGDTLWTRTFGGQDDDYARYVFTDRHNNIVVIGTTYSFGSGGSDVYIVNLDPMGDTIFTKVYGTSVDEFGLSGDMYYDNGLNMTYAFAYTRYDTAYSYQKARFFRTDTITGALIYDKGWFWLPGQTQIVENMKMRKDAPGKFYVSGNFKDDDEASSEIYIHRTDYGIEFSANQMVFYKQGEQSANDIRKCFDNGMVVTGSTTFYGPGPTATYILKTDTDLVSPPTVVAIDDIPTIQFGIYPNPVTGNMAFIDATSDIKTIRLFDMSGRMIQSIKGENFISQVIYIDPIPYGMYIIEVTTNEGIGRKKLLIAE